MWEKVKTRKHTVYKVFPARFHHLQPRTSTGAGAGAVDADAGDDDDVLEFMVYGSVDYTLRDTETGEEEKGERMDWAAHTELIRRSTGTGVVGHGTGQGTGHGTGNGDGNGEASTTKGNTSMFLFNKYRVYLSPSVE